MFLFCRCLLEDAGKRDYCGLNGCVADICAVYAYAVGNMDVKSADAFNYLLFHLRLRSPTFRPPLLLKFLSIDLLINGWIDLSIDPSILPFIDLSISSFPFAFPVLSYHDPRSVL